ncbi:MAG: RNA methyltransferase [Gammaproteobacteria bacterium]|nr:MAG: RNA methyltransferase [Gammaproteobacteria bacterium]
MREEQGSPPLAPELVQRVRMVMVEPTHPGNIGAAARAMKTMGLERLTLVNPLHFPDNEARLREARFRAASAVDVVDAATVVSTLAEAIDDCTLVIGASARSRRVPWPLVDAREAARAVLDEVPRGEVAILFGRESSGLTTEELARCQRHLHIATDPAYTSLNVAMAMQIVAYEIRQSWLDAGARPPEPAWDRPWAEAAAVEGLLEHLSEVLDQVNYYDRREPGQVMLRMRRLFFRTRLDQVEINILRGLLTNVQKRAGLAGKGSRDANLD